MADQRQSCVIPHKSIISTSVTWGLACKGHRQNNEFVLKANYVTLIVDILYDRLSLLIPDQELVSNKDEIGEFEPLVGPVVDPVAKAMMSLLSNLIEHLAFFLRDDKKTIDKCGVTDLKVSAKANNIPR